MQAGRSLVAVCLRKGALKGYLSANNSILIYSPAGPACSTGASLSSSSSLPELSKSSNSTHVLSSFFVAINFVILPFPVTDTICHDELTISCHPSQHSDKEAGDLVNSLQDVVRDF